MDNKEFIVSHPRAREPITVTGKTLKEALEKQGLDPNIWQEVAPLSPEEIASAGDLPSNDKPN